MMKIGDFGLAKLFDSSNESLSQTTAGVKGTLNYLSPEIVDKFLANQKIQYTKETDIWSFGCIMCEMITLKRTFDIKINDFKPLIEFKNADTINKDVGDALRAEKYERIDKITSLIEKLDLYS